MPEDKDILVIDVAQAAAPLARKLLLRPGFVALSPAMAPAQLAQLSWRPPCVLLHADSQQRPQWLRELLRLKWPIACLWPERDAAGRPDDDPNWLSPLAAAARKRRLPVCLLEAWRALPAAASVKELISGGCIGDVQEIVWSWSSKGIVSQRQRWFAADLCRWFAADGKDAVEEGNCAELDAAEELAANEALCQIQGSAGQVRLRFCLADGSACVESRLHTRQRRRDFAARRSLPLELSLLRRFASRDLKNWPALAMLNGERS
jgi:hypothetical protein